MTSLMTALTVLIRTKRSTQYTRFFLVHLHLDVNIQIFTLGVGSSYNNKLAGFETTTQTAQRAIQSEYSMTG